MFMFLHPSFSKASSRLALLAIYIHRRILRKLLQDGKIESTDNKENSPNKNKEKSPSKKENIPPKEPSVIFSHITQHDFFNMYDKIVGVTGTVGTEKDRIDFQNIYHHQYKEKYNYKIQ